MIKDPTAVPDLSFRATLRRGLSDYFERPLAAALARAGVTANALTLTGLGVAAASAALIGVGWMLAGGIVLLSSGLFDMLDGALARATGQTTKFGALLDSTVDRASEAVILLGAVVFYLTEDSEAGVVLAFVALTGSLLVSYVRARAEGLSIECEVGVMTRTERVLALSAGLIAAHWWQPGLAVVLGMIAVFGIVTIIHRLLFAWGQFRDGGESGPGAANDSEQGPG